MDEMIGYANAHGMQAAVHTIGDACLDRVLSAYEKALAENPREDHRHGIVHCQITRADQLEKIAKMHLHVYAQSIFLDYGAPLTGRAFLRPAAPDGRGSKNGRRCPQAPARPGAWLYICAEMC